MHGQVVVDDFTVFFVSPKASDPLEIMRITLDTALKFVDSKSKHELSTVERVRVFLTYFDLLINCCIKGF